MSSQVLYACLEMRMPIGELSFFSIATFLDFIDDYVKIKKQQYAKNGRIQEQESYDGAEGLDKFLGG